MRFDPELGSINSFCSKPECTRGYLHRHHRKNESLFIWQGNNDGLGEGWTNAKFIKFCERYHKFDPRDIVDLCSWHHAEIHLLYTREIDKDFRRKKFKPLRYYTYTESMNLMKKLDQICSAWLEKKTAGIDPNYLDTLRGIPNQKRKKRK